MKNALAHVVIVAQLMVTLPALARTSEGGTNNRGEHIEPLGHAGQSLEPFLLTPENKAALLGWTNGVIERVGHDPSFHNLNNLAAVLIRHGRFAKAMTLLQFLEGKYPGRFETASNMGSAYELLGQNKDALKWIRKGLKRNPDDHAGTEWLHVAILKAKLGQLAPPAPGRSILNLDFGNDMLPARPLQLPDGNNGKPVSLFALAMALRYQLIERIPFVHAPDPMVAGLLLDWANLELLAGSVESADVLFDAASRYGSSERKTIELRKKQVAVSLAAAKSRKTAVAGPCELCQAPAR